ncbi:MULTISPECIES: helix-turn-helix transcriptional regulator [Kordiimonas]|uniref:helix-turn-helix transcriptional regulator n=1 Tax=Kordiimonas TaxID=288021 RepID=UPI00257AC2FF|nr:AraC family transcriptional regulator [Kordiimonas sp. UBA4487]
MFEVLPSFITAAITFLLSLQVLRSDLEGRFKYYLALGIICFAALALAPYYNNPAAGDGERLFQITLYALANLGAVAWALIMFYLFEDKDLSSWPFWLVAVAALGIDVFDLWASRHGNWPNSWPMIIVFEYWPQIAKLGFFLLGTYALIRSWRAELLQSRFRLRQIVATIFSVVGIEMLVAENIVGIATKLPYEPQTFHMIWQLALAIWLFFALTRPQLADWATGKTKVKARKSRSWVKWGEKAAKLEKLLEDQQVYREPDLNVAKLAGMLALPEYRLRELINGEMGYKNFNVFLNDYRIDAACRDLKDPGKDNLPIISIAMEAGFNSLAPFNRAFKERMGMTPKAYRDGDGPT